MTSPKSNSLRRREQRDRQKIYRDQQRVLRRPSRDDIARVFLWQMMSRARQAGERRVDQMLDMIVTELTDQGFDERQSELAFGDLLDRYSNTDTPPFRRKVHLR